MRRGKKILSLALCAFLALAMTVTILPAKRAEAAAVSVDATLEDPATESYDTLSSANATLEAVSGIDSTNSILASSQINLIPGSAKTESQGYGFGEGYLGIDVMVVLETAIAHDSVVKVNYSVTYEGKTYTGTVDCKKMNTSTDDTSYFGAIDTVALPSSSSSTSDTSSSSSSTTDTSASDTTTTEATGISNETAAEQAVALAENGNAQRIGVPSGSRVKLNSVSAMTDANALAALPALVKTVEDATSQGVLQVFNFEINATGSGQIIINVGEAFAGNIAVVGHYTNGAFTTQQVKVQSNGYIYPSFASFSPVTVIVTNQTSAISAIPTTEKTVRNGSPSTGDTTTLLYIIALAAAGLLAVSRKRSR